MQTRRVAPSFAFTHPLRTIAVAVAVGLLVACGGGGSSPPAVAANGVDVANASAPGSTAGAPSAIDASTAAPAASVPVTHLSGSIVKGPVTGAQVCVYELLPTGKGKQLACTSSRADGSYALSLEFVGEVVVEAVGGTYTDETTGVVGVPLSAPLASATKLGGGPSVLHTTPLTALAYNQAVAPGAGGLSLANFEAKAGLVKDAFGLAADVDLKTTLPNVDAGSANAYGNALRGVSKMLGFGATLAGVVGNTDLESIKAGYQSAAQCLQSTIAPAKAMASMVPAGYFPTISLPRQTSVNSPDIRFGGVATEDGISEFQLINPKTEWRTLLATSTTPMGCTVTSDTAALVVLKCPQSALVGNLSIVGGAAAAVLPVPTELPRGEVLIVSQQVLAPTQIMVGGNLVITGAVQFLDNAGVTFSAGGSLFMPGPLLTAPQPPFVNPPGAGLAVVQTGCNSTTLAVTGAPSISGSGSISVQSETAPSSPFATKSLGGTGLLLVTGASIGASISAENYGSGITLQNTATITRGTLSLTASGQ